MRNVRSAMQSPKYAIRGGVADFSALLKFLYDSELSIRVCDASRICRKVSSLAFTKMGTSNIVILALL